MQIHELNNFSGALGAGSYLAVDDGNDTGKVSTQQLLAGAQEAIDNLDETLNTRIDNIIGGGTAPSAAEVTDARTGADGLVYSSLGTAIRTQITNVSDDISVIGNVIKRTVPSGTYYVPYSFKAGKTYICINLSPSGALSLKMRATKDGADLQTVHGLDAGTTKEFIANQDAAWMNGWNGSAQTFILIEKDSQYEKWENYEHKIDDLSHLRQPIDKITGGVIAQDGSITQNQYYTYTSYIDCSDYGKIRVISPNSPLNYCAWYDSNKDFISFFIIAQGDTIIEAPSGAKYCRISSTTAIMADVEVYTALYFKGLKTDEYVESIKGYLPNRLVGSRATGGLIDYPDYTIKKDHSYLIVNPNNFACSFSPLDSNGQDPALGSTTIAANSVEMRVAAADGYPRLWFNGNNGVLYVYDMDEEIRYQGIKDLNTDAINAIHSSRYKTSATPHIMSLLHFSDIHADATALRRIIKFRNDMANAIQDAICTGDITSSKYGDGLAFWNYSEGAEKILTCIGNHDSYYTNSMDPDQMVPMDTIASTYIDPFESYWGTIVRPTDKTYYYKDYAEGYRLIVLDSIRIGSEAINEGAWLENVLADARTNDLAVIIAMHYMPTGGMHIYDCAFSKYGTFGDSGYICNAPDFAVEDFVQAFINAGGIFMGYLIGHLHRDIFGYVEGYPDQLCIMVTTANPHNGDIEINADLGRVIGEKSQDAFNVVTFDRDNNMVKVIRVGADIDNLMRPRKAISYNISAKSFPQR